MTRTTFEDAIIHLVDYLGATNPSEAVQRDAKRAIQEAYRDLANAQRWSYLVRHGRVMTRAPYYGIDPSGVNPQATISYTQATRTVTLSGGTWPTWAAGGYLRASGGNTPDDLGLVQYRVESRASATSLTLDSEVNPGADIAGGAFFCLYQDTYLLPADYIGNDQTLYERNFGGMEYTSPKDWLFENRYVFAEGTPRWYTITGDPQYPGRLVIRIYPFPSESRSLDFIYHRRPRTLAIARQSIGPLSIASGSATVSGANFTPGLVGSVCRVSGIARLMPTSTIGENPAVLEGTILSVADNGATMTLDTAATSTASGLPAVVSDPIDLEDGAMLNAFWRCCEMHLAYGRTLKDKPSAAPLYRAALVLAKQSDSRSFAGRSVGDCGPTRQRLRDMPFTFNVE